MDFTFYIKICIIMYLFCLFTLCTRFKNIDLKDRPCRITYKDINVLIFILEQMQHIISIYWSPIRSLKHMKPKLNPITKQKQSPIFFYFAYTYDNLSPVLTLCQQNSLGSYTSMCPDSITVLRWRSLMDWLCKCHHFMNHRI